MTTIKRPIKRIASVGEVMIELIAGNGNSATLGVAGDTFNTAVYMARALRDTDTSISFVTALGTDPYSDRILSEIRSHGIAISHIERRDGQLPGLYAIETDELGERSFAYWRSASAARSLFSPPCTVTPDSLNDFDLVLISGISLAILPANIRATIVDWAKDFTAAGGTLAYDSNFRPALWDDPEIAQQTNTEIWALTDIALPSIDDEMALFGDATPEDVLTRLQKTGVTRGVLKRGADGPLDLSSGRVPNGLSHVAKVVDSTAAGDSFNAGYLAALVMGKSDIEAARAGHNLAAQVIQHPGAIIPEGL